MRESYPLASAFLTSFASREDVCRRPDARAVRGEDASSAELAALDGTLSRIVSTARATWSTFTVDDEPFVELLATKVDPSKVPDASLLELRCNDLFLVAGCLRGNAAALLAFEKNYFSDVDRILRSFAKGGTDTEDILQSVREKLFMGSGLAAPKLASYAGKGDLRGWFRVVVTRAVLNATRSTRERFADDDDALLRLPAVGDPELDPMRSHYATELRSVFPAALATLTVDERRLLRQRYLDGLTHDAMAAVNRIHRATVKRQLNAAHHGLNVALRELLMKKLGIDRAEYESILRLIRSEFDLTLRRILESQDG